MRAAPPATESIAVLINPRAGRGRRHDDIPGVLDRLRTSGRDVTVLSADSVDAALGACHDAVASGVGALVAIGGDGTVNVALQAVAGTGVAFGAIPAGTGNDFVREIGLPGSLPAAADTIAEALRSGHRRPIDLAHMVPAEGPSRWFGAVLGAGFDAIVNERANRMRFPLGRRRYDIAILAEMARLRPKAYTMTLDGVDYHFDAVIVAIGNTQSYGGGLRICPSADATDGLLDIVVAGPISRTTMMRLKPRLHAGTHVGHPAVTTHRAHTVELAAEGIVAYADGERMSPLPLTVTAMPAALSLLA